MCVRDSSCRCPLLFHEQSAHVYSWLSAAERSRARLCRGFKRGFFVCVVPSDVRTKKLKEVCFGFGFWVGFLCVVFYVLPGLLIYRSMGGGVCFFFLALFCFHYFVLFLIVFGSLRFPRNELDNLRHYDLHVYHHPLCSLAKKIN